VGRGADVLVAVTNDAWFGRSNMPWHHLGLAVVRAIEVRRSVVRSANTGISAFVDPLGRVTARTELFEEAVLEEAVPILDVRTVYGRLGDFVLWILYGAGAAVLVVTGWSAPPVPVSSRAPRGG
jgi:Apolipoprotein N-acyltransferase